MIDIEQAKSLRAQGKTLKEIGLQFGVTRERVRQVIGNVGFKIHALRKEKEYYRERLYGTCDITVEEICGLFHVTPNGVRKELGSRLRYYNEHGLRWCCNHKRGLPIEMFWTNGKVRYSICKECSLDRHSKWYQQNKERVKDTSTNWRKNNLERYRAYHRAYQKKNWDKIKAARQARKEQYEETHGR